MPSEIPYPCFGAHMSVAGGLEKAVALAHAAECACVQIFTKNNNQWGCKPLADAQVSAWKDALREYGIVCPVAHASYLINLASPDDTLWKKSIDALIIEWQRADLLELDGLVVHPGAHTSSTVEAGLQRIVEGVGIAAEAADPKKTLLLLENTAGQGSCLGHSFSQLGWLIEKIQLPERVGVCLDTCHAFAAGYALNTDDGFRAMRDEILNELPAGTIRALHLNDSKKECGSRVDRHEHIGEGCIGEEGFRLVLQDSILGRLPGYLETPKGTDEATGEDLDHKNIRRLKEIAGGVKAG